MKSRMEKYYEQESTDSSLRRTNRNQELYTSINKVDIENVEVKPNVQVLNTNVQNIDVEKLREEISNKYVQNTPQEEVKEEPILKEEIKDYDINNVLIKAKDSKKVDYDQDRLKKLRDTQYDILKSLELNEEENKKEVPLENELEELIKTVTMKKPVEEETAEPLDLLSDLKGSENTQVLPGLTEELENATKHIPLPEEKQKTEEKIDKSFYTTTNMFTQSDFDDFNDLKKDVKSSKSIINFLIVIIIIAVIVGIFFLLNNLLELNLI